MKKTSSDLRALKQAGIPISAITCYDYPSALWVDGADTDLIVVGDSVGTNVLGYTSEKEVTLGDIAHHVGAVSRGAKHSYILADLPYGTCETPDAALLNARQLIIAGADGVKMEGFKPSIIEHLVANGIEVVAHLGLMPQIHDTKAFRAKRADTALRLLDESLGLEAAGAWGIVLELVPENVARVVSERLAIPSIGIGAGRYTDGQVLILLDALGIHELDFRHNRRFADLRTVACDALRVYVTAVRQRSFPEEAHTRNLAPEEWQRFEAALAQRPNTRDE